MFNEPGFEHTQLRDCRLVFILFHILINNLGGGFNMLIEWHLQCEPCWKTLQREGILERPVWVGRWGGLAWAGPLQKGCVKGGCGGSQRARPFTGVATLGLKGCSLHGWPSRELFCNVLLTSTSGQIWENNQKHRFSTLRRKPDCSNAQTHLEAALP